MKTSDFFYELPHELIAQTPSAQRDHSRLLIYDRKTGALTDSIFTGILGELNAGDCLVLNRTRVIPARLIGSKVGSGGAMEFLLLKRLDENRWETLVRPGKKAKEGARFEFGNTIFATVEGQAEGGARVVKFEYDGVWEEVLDKVGTMPLPPYITERLEDKERYQTVYSKESGSAAAPTAGLHFTQALLDDIKQKGVAVEEILLHVGLGTFRPVKSENVEEHEMHSEYYEVTEQNAENINKARANGGRIVCVGTTSCRTLETVTDDAGVVHAGKGMTNIFITPGYKFKAVDALITNFHLPESTLLMLVSALMGREEALRAYEHAVSERYRFFSFGDAMFIK